MKILMTADAVGGVWTYSLDLTRALARFGIDVVLVVLGPPPTDVQRGHARRIGNLELIEYPCKLEWMPGAWPDVTSSGEQLRRIADAHAPDLVHLNGYSHGAIDFGVPSIVVAHSCVLSWWLAVRKTAWPDEYAAYRRHVERGLAGTNAIVAPSVAMAATLLSIYRPHSDVRVIYNGRDRTMFTPRPKMSLVFSAGRLWDEAKNVAALQKAAPQSPWPIYVAGDDEVASEQAGGCLNIGRLSPIEIAAWMRRAAIYALPARYEPFGLSVLEAALCECALILGDIPSLRELWDGAAWFVDPDDTAALAARLAHAATHHHSRRRMAARAHDRAATLTVEQMGANYAGLYAELRAGAAHSKGHHSCAS